MSLIIKNINQPFDLPSIMRHVGAWWTESYHLEGVDQRLSDYRFIAERSYKTIKSWLETNKIPSTQRLLAAYESEGGLQGVAITEFRKSRKNQRPFIEVRFLLTALSNASFQKQRKVKGTGCALLAKAIKLDENSKCLYASSLESAKLFYKNAGFIETNRRIGDKDYKLISGNFEKFVSRFASKDSSDEEEAVEEPIEVNDVFIYVKALNSLL